MQPLQWPAAMATMCCCKGAPKVRRLQGCLSFPCLCISEDKPWKKNKDVDQGLREQVVYICSCIQLLFAELYVQLSKLEENTPFHDDVHYA